MIYMDKNLSKDKLFEIEQDKLLGIMRIDWCDGGLSNRWNPSDLMIDLNNKKELDIKKLQEEINYIQFQLLRDFSIVEKLCNGRGYDKESVFYIDM